MEFCVVSNAVINPLKQRGDRVTPWNLLRVRALFECRNELAETFLSNSRYSIRVVDG